jgi:putative Holliday junction resolvase
LHHLSRTKDAQAIIQIAEEHDVDLILVGLPLDLEGRPGPQARKSQRLAQSIKDQTQGEVILVDESGSSRAAGIRDLMHDARSAAVFLQEYLDAQNT